MQSKVGESQSHRWGSRIRSHLRMRRTGHIECDTVTSLSRTHGIHTSLAPAHTCLAGKTPLYSAFLLLHDFTLFSTYLFPSCSPCSGSLSATRLPADLWWLRRVFTRWKPPERLFGGSRRGTSASSDPVTSAADPSRPRSFP